MASPSGSLLAGRAAQQQTWEGNKPRAASSRAAISTAGLGQKKRRTGSKGDSPGSRVHRSGQQKSTARLYGTDLAGQTEIWAGKKIFGQSVLYLG